MTPAPLRRLSAISGNTIRELVRNRFLYILLVVTVLLIFGSLAIAQFTIGDWDRVIIDLGLAAVELSGVLITVFVGSSLVAGEIERRTIYPTLARPIGRAEFLLGRFAGLVSLVALEVAVMTAVLAGVLKAIAFPVPVALASAAGLLILELALVAAFAMFFASFSTPVLSASFTLSMYLVGHFLGDVQRSSDRARGLARALTKAAWVVLPDLELFNAKTAASSGLPVSWSFAWRAIVYGVLYTGALLAFAIALFSRRDLK